MRQTSVEKIAQRHAVGLEPGEVVRAGDFVMIRPKHVMTHDNTGAVIPKFQSIGATRLADPKQPVFGMDHDVQNTSPENLAKYAKIQAFAKEHGVDYYPPGRGIAHQVMVEEGYVTPGSMCVGSDSHSNLYGAAGALGTPVVRTDAAALWATGMTWWQIPPVVRVTLEGKLRPGATGKDVIITLCGHFNNDEVLNCAVEFHGVGVEHLSADERMTISNMTTEWGALVGMFPFDKVWRTYMLSRADHFAMRGDANPRYTRDDVDEMWSRRHEFAPDADAFYEKELTLDLSTVTPHVSGPDTVKDMTSLPEMQKRHVKIDRAYLMSCVNARLSDFAETAAVFKGGDGPVKKVASHVKFYVAAASSEVEEEARR
ncbi:MAG: aconitase family protein, partial [Planctomycetota bacterium]|nr:aconitase family protein [Planctomycetota bacterium]